MTSKLPVQPMLFYHSRIHKGSSSCMILALVSQTGPAVPVKEVIASL